MAFNSKKNKPSQIKSPFDGARKTETSWGVVASWYDELLKGEKTFQKEIILPNLLRMMDIKKEDRIIDIACGQGFFTNEFAKLGAEVYGTDISKELVDLANKNSPESIKYFVSSAHKIAFAENNSFDKATIILASQNMENFSAVLKECSRILKSGGKLFLVLNHPAFRIPQKSDWGFDENKNIQYREVEQYMSEIMTKIDMNPGERDLRMKKYTVSFHKPLQSYFKDFKNSGFCVENLEEWVSNKKSQPGFRQKAEDKARKEIPLFMCIELVKN